MEPHHEAGRRGTPCRFRRRSVGIRIARSRNFEKLESVHRAIADDDRFRGDDRSGNYPGIRNLGESADGRLPRFADAADRFGIPPQPVAFRDGILLGQTLFGGRERTIALAHWRQLRRFGSSERLPDRQFDLLRLATVVRRNSPQGDRGGSGKRRTPAAMGPGRLYVDTPLRHLAGSQGSVGAYLRQSRLPDYSFVAGESHAGHLREVRAFRQPLRGVGFDGGRCLAGRIRSADDRSAAILRARTGSAPASGQNNPGSGDQPHGVGLLALRKPSRMVPAACGRPLRQSRGLGHDLGGFGRTGAQRSQFGKAVGGSLFDVVSPGRRRFPLRRRVHGAVADVALSDGSGAARISEYYFSARRTGRFLGSDRAVVDSRRHAVGLFRIVSELFGRAGVLVFGLRLAAKPVFGTLRPL